MLPGNYITFPWSIPFPFSYMTLSHLLFLSLHTSQHVLLHPNSPLWILIPSFFFLSSFIFLSFLLSTSKHFFSFPSHQNTNSLLPDQNQSFLKHLIHSLSPMMPSTFSKRINLPTSGIVKDEVPLLKQIPYSALHCKYLCSALLHSLTGLVGFWQTLQDFSTEMIV